MECRSTVTLVNIILCNYHRELAKKYCKLVLLWLFIDVGTEVYSCDLLLFMGVVVAKLENLKQNGGVLVLE